MNKEVLHVIGCSIAWLETIESEEPKVSPIINELAKIKKDLLKDDRQLELTICQ